jgi:YHS domain-containing protein
MTAARQERKARRFRAGLGAGLQAFAAAFLAALTLTGLAGTSTEAATTEWVVSNRYTGLAIDGFDPVAYFVDGAPKEGRAELEFSFGGITWRFRNEGNRAAFAAAPEIYAPRFGGHDPMAVLRGSAAPGHPQLWLIAAQRLYLFYSAEARAAFARDPQSAIEAAERSWPELQRRLVRN